MLAYYSSVQLLIIFSVIMYVLHIWVRMEVIFYFIHDYYLYYRTAIFFFLVVVVVVLLLVVLF